MNSKNKIPEITAHGRFQPPLHINHFNYIKTAFDLAKKVHILITNPNFEEKETKKAPHRNERRNNPFTYNERVSIFKSFFKNYGIPSSRYDFIPFDITDDNSWKKLKKRVPNLINVYSPWSKEKVKKFRKHKMKVIQLNMPRLENFSGDKLRFILRKKMSTTNKKKELIMAGYMKEAIPALFKVLNK